MPGADWFGRWPALPVPAATMPPKEPPPVKKAPAVVVKRPPITKPKGDRP